MANLRVSEYTLSGGNTVPPVLPGEYNTQQTIALGGTSAVVANAFGSNTTHVHLQAEGICSVKFGAGTPVAVVGAGYRLAAGEGQTFAVASGQKVAAITDT